MRVAFRFMWLLMVALAMAACANKEPEQRAAFIAWLQASVVDAPGAAVPGLDEAQRDALGDYVDHYAVLADFDAVAASAVRRLARALEHEELHSLAQLQARREALQTDRQALAEVQGELRDALARARSERAELEQPADLLPVYAQAYDLAVARPAARLAPMIDVVVAALNDALRVADFVAEHQDQISLDAESAAVRDPSVQQALNHLLDQLNSHSAAIEQAQRNLRAMQPA
ncbi:DUF3053 family protein [Bordetella petrii]|uniref:DUF3053 family protein n=1 Tax=Bordetella petrii TaxID=94624 RepID=UPI001E532748|nr:DUF3053 family protein [Bordetella petrii]MCD0502263.1 DUF3053 domain-containing protein [Bordetella petrii]